MNFKNFLIESEQKDNIKEIIKKLPQKVKKLIKGYKFKLESGVTLKNDNEHVGELDQNNKKITTCSPIKYSREFVILHEIGHLIWETLTKKQKKEWEKIAKSIKSKKMNDEENFCHAFSSYHSSYPLDKYNKKEIIDFIKKIVH